MKYSIVLTETAQADLSAIFRYIAVDLQSVQNANAQLSRIEKAIASLNQMPERYRVYDRKNWRERNLRIMWITTLFSMSPRTMTPRLQSCASCTAAETLTGSLRCWKRNK